MSAPEPVEVKNFTVWSLLKQYRTLIVLSALTSILFSSLALTMPWMLKIAIDKILPARDYRLFFVLFGVMLIIYSMRYIMRLITGYLGTYTVTRVLLDVRQRIFRHLQSLSLRFYEEYRTGKLISNVISDVALLQGLLALFIGMTDVLVTMLLIYGLLFFLNWKLGLMILCIAPLHFFNFVHFRRILRENSLQLQEKMSEISANLAETINGIKVVKAFAKERAECRRFFTTMRPTLDLTIRMNIEGNLCAGNYDMLTVLTYLGTIGFGVSFVADGQMTLGEFVAFYTYVGWQLAPLSVLATQINSLAQGLSGIQRLTRLLKTIPEIREASNPLKAGTLRGDIQFEDVSFSYGDTPVIKHLTLEIKPGQKVALVGPSGCGKSTISNLLLRFYDVSSGRILVDSVDVRKYSIASYHGNVGVVLQEPFLFSGTIRDNIAYARMTASREEIENAAKLANVEEFVLKLENGYDTLIGENGASLSGGQKQRLAIARAVLKNPSILILDEATSALDTVSEKLVQQALDKLMENRTTIIIAHRLSTIRNADVIVVLRAGEIVQKGTHDELMAAGGVYADLYTTQQKSARETPPPPDASP